MWDDRLPPRVEGVPERIRVVLGGIRNRLAFYAGLVDEAWVGDARATRQPDWSCGGWVTSRGVGPFQGGAGTFGG